MDYAPKKIRGAYKSFKRLSILFLFVLSFDQESFFPFCFGDEKKRKKTTDRLQVFCFHVVVFIVALFLRQYN